MTDIGYISVWWIFFVILGITSFPLSHLLFAKFFDRGWGLSKTVGILVISYAAFLGSISKVIPFTQLFLFLYCALFVGVNIIILSKNWSILKKDVWENRRVIIMSEILFALGLLFWAYVRGHQPDINGLEKFMDYGFINTILRGEYLPPKDMWASPLTINYYWYGQYVTAFITKLLGMPSRITYNLMLATILGFALSSAFSIVATLIQSQFKKIDKRVIFIGAIISAIVLSFGGNFHTPYYVWKNGAEKYWYPDATRFIGYNPDTNDKTIHEFPLYSFVVADLHAHLLNFPFVLVFIGLLLSTILDDKINKWKNLIPLGFVLGIMFMTSTWDFGNYAILTGVAFGYSALKQKKVSLDAIVMAAIPTLKVFVLGILFALPFILNFESIAQGIGFVNATSPLWQLAILWGVPVILMTTFLGITPITRFFRFSKSDLFVLALLTTSFILILIPEVVFVKDIYIATHQRANTMFKLTYQSFIMSYLVFGYVAVRLLHSVKNQGLKLVSFLGVVTVLSSLLIYPYFAIKSYYGNIFARTNEYTQLPSYKGLDGETWARTSRPEEYAVIQWLRENVEGQPTILEAQGDSYTEFNIISSYTGLPTIEGWYVHEWLWRGTADFPQGRADEVQQLYVSPDLSLTKSLLDKYAVKYVVVGNFERQKYPDLNTAKWNTLGKPVFTSGATTLYEIL